MSAIRLLCLATALAPAATANAAPRLVGGVGEPGCAAALSMAEAAFRSPSASLDWPIAAPRSDLRLVLRPNAEDISGGHAVDFDPRIFTVMQRTVDSFSSSEFRSRRVYAGRRLIIADRPHGWQGNRYTVTLEDNSATSQPSATPPVIEERWKVPIVLADTSADRLWVIDRQEPWMVMPAWRVHAVDATGHRQPCRVEFGVQDSALPLLPAAVRRYAGLLDEALGTDGPGTLHPVTRQRLTAERDWANVARRPWALTDPPYNSAAEVERGLATWSQGAPARRRLLVRLRTARPAAQRALAVYFARNGLATAPEAADALSRKAIDHMSRTYFIFAKGR